MNEMNKLYKAMLMAHNCVIKPDYQIVLLMRDEHGKDQEIPIKIDDMPVYLPVTEVLNNAASMGKVFFHPACENIASKETEVFKIIRRLGSMRLLELFKQYPVVLFSVANGKEKRSWNQKILDMVEPFKGIKKSVVDEVFNLLGRFRVEVDDNGIDNRFIHLKISKPQGRSSSGSGERVYYRTKPVFPIYGEILRRLSQSEGNPDNHTVELNGYSVSRAALKLTAHLFRVVLPAVVDPDEVSSESTTSIASRLISYTGCFEQIAEQMNRIQNLFRSDFDKLMIYPIDLSWTEQMGEVSDLVRQIPALDYNTNNTQEEVTPANLSNMGSIFSVSSTPNQGLNNQHQQQHVIVQQGGQPQPINGMVGDFNVTPPQMINGDRYVRFEIAPHANQVLHHAINALTNMPVIYYCTKSGSLLQRVDAAVQQPHSTIPGIGLPNMGTSGMNPALLALAALNPSLLGSVMGVNQPTPVSTPNYSSNTVVSGYDNGMTPLF